MQTTLIARLASGARSLWLNIPDNVRGAVWVLLTALTMGVQAALVRLLGEAIDSMQIIFLRGLFGLVLIIPLFLRPGVIRLRTSRLPLHLARAIVGVLSMACGFYAFANMPLAEATAITFTMPLFMTVLAALLLNELVGPRRATATLIGFVGVLIMLRPLDLAFELAAFMALLSALFHALSGIFVKRLSATESLANLLVYFTLVATIVFLIPAMRVWIQPTGLQWIYLFGVTFLGVLSQLTFIRGCQLSEMSTVAPLDYSRLVVAIVLGYFWFAEVPDVWSVAGTFVIVGSTLYITRREAYLARIGGLSTMTSEHASHAESSIATTTSLEAPTTASSVPSSKPTDAN